jgi:NAD(P)-dependent dehydrogenase (short-subunit alcohol dehydrogenase family)
MPNSAVRKKQKTIKKHIFFHGVQYAGGCSDHKKKRREISLVKFLVSDAAGYITGDTIHVNGGMYMA